MNKIVFTGFMAAVLGISGASAAVTNNSYTTKGYVDDGLRAVNAKAVAAQSAASSAQSTANAAQSAASDAASAASSAFSLASDASALASSLQSIVGADANSGLRSTVGSLSTTVGALDSDINDQTNGLKAKVAALEARPAGTTYTAGDGISIDTTTNTISVNAFQSSTQTGNTDKIYVIQNGQLVEWSEPDAADTWDSSILN